MLLIADEQKGIALAGVMGGQNTEINDNTVDVLIESAYFKPQNIRAHLARSSGCAPTSSYRFERGADIGICDWASQRARAVDSGNRRRHSWPKASWTPTRSRSQPKQITLRHHKVNELLGVELQPGRNRMLPAASSGLKAVDRKARPRRPRTVRRSR